MNHSLVWLLSKIPRDINFQLAPFCLTNFPIGICQMEKENTKAIKGEPTYLKLVKKKANNFGICALIMKFVLK